MKLENLLENFLKEIVELPEDIKKNKEHPKAIDIKNKYLIKSLISHSNNGFTGFQLILINNIKNSTDLVELVKQIIKHPTGKEVLISAIAMNNNYGDNGFAYLLKLVTIDKIINIINLLSQSNEDKNKLAKIVSQYLFKKNNILLEKLDLSQNNLINTINIYFEILEENDSNLKHSSSFKNLKETFKSKKGVCFGLCLANGSMEIDGFDNWWKAILANIVANNFFLKLKLPLLDKIKLRNVTLSDGTIIPAPKINNKSSNLYKAIELFIEFVCQNQAPEVSFGSENVAQPDMVKAYNNQDIRFEMISNRGQLLTFNNNITFTGNIPLNNLQIWLKENIINFDNTLLIFDANRHSTSLRFCSIKKLWIYYDPNNHKYESFFKHNQINLLLRKITTSHMEKPMLNACEEPLFFDGAIIVISFTNSLLNISNLEMPINNLISEQSLDKILKYIPEQLPNIMEKIANTNEGKLLIAKSFIWKTPKNNVSGLLSYLIFKPETISKIIDLTKDSIECQSILADAICLRADNKMSFMSSFNIESNRKYIKEIIHTLVKFDYGIKKLSEYLTIQDSMDQCILHALSDLDPALLGDVVFYIKKSTLGKRQLTKSLDLPNNLGITPKKILHLKTPYILINIEDALADKIGCDFPPEYQPKPLDALSIKNYKFKL